MRLDELAGRVAEVEAGDPHAFALAGEHSCAQRPAQRVSLLYLAAAERTPVAGGECLHDRRRRPENVDDDGVCAEAASTGVKATWTRTGRL